MDVGHRGNGAGLLSLKRKPAALLDARSRQLRFALRCHEAFRDGLGDRNTSCDFEKLTFRVR